jgi:hypothetical protein
MYPTEAYVRSVLGHHEPRLRGMFERAWQTVASLPGRSQLDYKRTVATLMHQYMMNEVRGEFIDDCDVRTMESHETIRLLVGRTLVVRLKKMDGRGFARAIPTQTTLALTNALDAPLFDLSEVPPIFNVDMGYVLNELETKIDHVLVAARMGEAVIWSYEADRGATAAASTISPAPAVPLSPARVIKLPVNSQDRKDTGRT